MEGVRITEHLAPGRLEAELAKVEDRRDPPVSVVVRLPLDGGEHEGLLYGWAANPRGAGGGTRGLVVLVREYTPGFAAELLTWVRAESVRQR